MPDIDYSSALLPYLQSPQAPENQNSPNYAQHLQQLYGLDPSQIAMAPQSAAGTVGPNAANAVGRSVGGAAVAPLWDAGQYLGGLIHGNEQWDPTRATQLGGNLALNFLPFGRAASLAKGGADLLENAAPRAATNLGMDEASRMARARSMGYTTDAYHGTSSLDVDRPAATEFNQFKISPEDIGIHFGTPEHASDRLSASDAPD